MGIFDKFRKENRNGETKEISNITLNQEGSIEILLSEEQLRNVTFLDTTSPELIQKLKEDLERLIKDTKEKGKIEKFMIIRDDDIFPRDWEWRVASKETAIAKVCLSLSFEIKEQLALEKVNLLPKTSNGIEIPPPISPEKKNELLSQVEKETGFVYLPAHFRSTKHFTINTPLSVTGNYNGVNANRNFTVIDNMSAFLTSNYAYSVAYHDAYLDVTHASLPISKDAVVLIAEEKYKEMLKSNKIPEELFQRKVIIYKGEEQLAINIVLAELGALPSQISEDYAYYDQTTHNIIDNSIKDLAREHGLLYDQNHGGKKGHFTDKFDEKNNEYNIALEQFATYLKQQFPEYEKMFTSKSIQDGYNSHQIVKTIGARKLLQAIEVYNKQTKIDFEVKLNRYKQDRMNVTKEIDMMFQKTLDCIKSYYSNSENNNIPFGKKNEIEELIRHFFHDLTMQEQLIAAKKIWETLKKGKNYETDVILPNSLPEDNMETSLKI